MQACVKIGTDVDVSHRNTTTTQITLTHKQTPPKQQNVKTHQTKQAKTYTFYKSTASATHTISLLPISKHYCIIKHFI